MAETDTGKRPPRPAELDERTAALERALTERVLVLDGATGTAMQAAGLSAADFGGPELEGCNEQLVVTRPDLVQAVHRDYLRSGADIVETNSFGGTPLVLAEYGLGEQAFDLNRRAAELARQACAELSTAERPRFVAGSMGPTTTAISVTGGIAFDELAEHFRVQALGLMAGGADYLLVETCQDTLNLKAALEGCAQAFAECDWRLPVAVSATIELAGTMLGGQDAEALAVALEHADLLYLGLNCATGPERMREHIRTLSMLARTRLACVPNAGLPDEDGRYLEGPQELARVLSEFLDAGWLNLIGGCCGTTAEHVAALAAVASGRAPRVVPEHSRCMVSGLEAVELEEDNRPLLVGERTNVLGSAKFRRLIEADDWEGAAEVGRAQVSTGAQIIDVCLQNPERNEIEDMERLLPLLARRVRVPWMIDTTDPQVMARALRHAQGKSVLNSVNLEDGRERFDRVVGLARRFGAAVIVGLIDEQGMAMTVERKLDVARRCWPILTGDHGLRPENIWWDALVFPCATGDEAVLGAPAATLEAVTTLRREFPGSRTVLGISNVSFGLPPAGREVLNAVYLYHATRAGLDAAIVNTQRLARYAEIPPDERALAEELLAVGPGEVDRSRRAVERYVATFRGRTRSAEVSPDADLPVDERLARAIVTGSKATLAEDLAEALDDPRWGTPLDLINGPLMDGMAEVGRLFNDNQLIVAEVLQSAEVMKAAVDRLEPLLERAAAGGRGRVVLATVKGDVHDIGKNLVDIILSNNGFEVINLGIRVTSEQLLDALREHQPDVVGLSGLLVKSAQQMVLTASDLRAAGIAVPMVVGGAALSRRFTHAKIAPAYGALVTYAADAMHGLEIVQRMTDPHARRELEEEVAAQLVAADGSGSSPRRTSGGGVVARPPLRRDLPAPVPPDLERHAETLDLEEVWSLLNPQMLYGRHLGFKGSVRRARERGDAKLQRIEDVVAELKAECRAGAMTAQAVWRFFPASAKGDRLRLTDQVTGDLVAEWELPRQERGGLCLTDYILANDHVALLVTTAGAGISERVAALKEAGEYLKSHGLAALALETAEAAAELLHARLRAAWGFADGDEVTTDDRLAARYRGKRYSFGYPACPDLAGQRQLFEALDPSDIGVTLTEGDMMDPEASVSALVFHHPDARYFNVG